MLLDFTNWNRLVLTIVTRNNPAYLDNVLNYDDSLLYASRQVSKLALFVLLVVY